MLDRVKSMFRGRNLEEEKTRLEEKILIGTQFENFIREFYPIFDEHVFKIFEKELYDTWIKLEPKNVEGIRNAQSMQMVIDKLRTRINQIIEDGQFAQYQLTNSTRNDSEE